MFVQNHLFQPDLEELCFTEDVTKVNRDGGGYFIPSCIVCVICCSSAYLINIFNVIVLLIKAMLYFAVPKKGELPCIDGYPECQTCVTGDDIVMLRSMITDVLCLNSQPQLMCAHKAPGEVQ